MFYKNMFSATKLDERNILHTKDISGSFLNLY